MLSASSIKKVIGCLTKGKLKSKAGLDDEDVMKGSQSIARMVEINTILASALGHNKEKMDDMKKRIDGTLKYNRTGFTYCTSMHG